MKPKVVKSQKRPFASASPRKSPTTEASVPDRERLHRAPRRSTWRREAPSVRSVANSRVRCAIVIESEFAITNAPTKSATPPKREQELLQEGEEAVDVLRVLRRLRVAAAHLRAGRQDRAHARDQLRLRDTGLLRDPDLVELAVLVEQRLRGRQVEAGERRSADRRRRRRTWRFRRSGTARPGRATGSRSSGRPRSASCRPSTCRRSPRPPSARRLRRGSAS